MDIYTVNDLSSLCPCSCDGCLVVIVIWVFIQ